MTPPSGATANALATSSPPAALLAIPLAKVASTAPLPAPVPVVTRMTPMSSHPLLPNDYGHDAFLSPLTEPLTYALPAGPATMVGCSTVDASAVTSTPLLPNVVSRVPSALKRATTTLLGVPLTPATTAPSPLSMI